MEEGRRDGAEHPGGSCTLGGEHTPEGVDFRTAGDLNGDDQLFEGRSEEATGSDGGRLLIILFQ